MPAQLASTEEIITAYRETGSVWKAAKRLGLCGQSVWERLRALGYRLPGRRWTDEEHQELRNLAGTCNLSEIARRLGRPYGAIATKISELGLSGRVRMGRRPVSLRGTGLTRKAVRRLIQELPSFSGTITQFSRQRGLSVDLVVKAIQKYEPDFWARYSQDASRLGSKECPNCGTRFYPLSGKQRTCSRKCQAHARADRQYFNGQRRFTVGLAEGICQICERPRASLSSHHVWGKEHDPEATFLLAVCQGCHQLVSRLASNKLVGDSAFLERLIIYASMRRHGARKPPGYHVIVDVDELTQEEAGDSTW